MQKKFVVYKSSAGSGKTYTLVLEYLKLALSDNSNSTKTYKKILAVTFTNKAASEMKLRVIDALKNITSQNPKTIELTGTIAYALKTDLETIRYRAENLLSDILHNYSDFSISTIDSFTHKIVKTFAYELKLPLNFTIETNVNGFYQKVVSGLMSKIGENPELTNLLVQYSANSAQENTSWDPELKLIEFTSLIQKEDATLNLLQLKNYSKEQLRHIQKELQKSIHVFKSIVRNAGEQGLLLIKRNNLTDNNFAYTKSGPQNCFKKWANFQNEKPEDIISKRSYDAASNNKWNNNKNSSSENIALDSISPELSKITLETLDYIEKNKKQYALNNLLEKNIYVLILVNELEQISNEFKTDEQVVFISEFNSRISEIVANEPSPFIYERLGERYSHFLLDEFQDTSTLQWLNLLPLIDNSLANDKFNLIVGDGKQSIYRWRNANVMQFNSLPRIFNPQHNPVLSEREATLVRNYEGKVLETNYRSLKNIVEFNNSIFDYLPSKLLNEDYRSIYNLHRQKTKHQNGGYVSIQYGETSKDDIDNINFELIQKHILSALNSQFSYNDICIIVRNNKNGNSIANYLLENNIPVISSDSLLLKNNAEINCVISFLKYLNNPSDIISASSVISYVSAKRRELPQLLSQLNRQKDLFELLNLLSIYIYKNSFTQKNVFDSCIEIITKLKLETRNSQYIRFFLDEVNDYLVNKSGSINDFLMWWDKRKDQASLIIPEGANAVRIMTIHKSKGLEFPIVICPYVNWTVYRADNSWVNLENMETELPVGVMKISSGLSEAGLGNIFEHEKNEQFLDNLNLLYVSFTRAVERLHVISYKSTTQKQETVYAWIKSFIESASSLGNQGIYELGTLKTKQLEESKTHNEIFDISSIHFNSNSQLINIKASYKLNTSEESKFALENGIKMHYILSEINTIREIPGVISRMINQGVIKREESETLNQKLFAILNNPLIKEFYIKEHVIKNESEIITESGEILRPDKIILHGKQAVVIDYKTGQKDTKRYAKQMFKYANALEQMGYVSTKKLLVYIDENLVEELQ